MTRRPTHCFHCGKEARSLTLEDLDKWKAEKISLTQMARNLKVGRATLYRKIKVLRDGKK